MNIAEKFFEGYQDHYVPELIEKIFKEHGKSCKGNIIPKYTFEDDSYIETYGGEIVTVNGKYSDEYYSNLEEDDEGD